MPSNESYMTLDEASDYFDRINAIRRPPDVLYTTTDPWEFEEANKAFLDCRATTLGGTYGFVLEIKQPQAFDGITVFEIKIKPTYAQYVPFDVTTHQLQEDSMKVYEGIIVKLDEQGQAVDVLRVVAPFVAKDMAIAQKTVLVDYAAENKLSGKDAAALQVRVREFPIA